MGAAVHAVAGAGCPYRGCPARGFTELGSARVLGCEARSRDVGIAGIASCSPRAASGATAGVERRPTRRHACCARWGCTRADLGRGRSARIGGAGSAGRRSGAGPAVPRAGVGRTATGLRATAPSIRSSRRRATTAPRSGAAAPIVGVAFSCGCRSAGTGLESPGRTVVGCRAAGPICAARDRLGRAGACGRTGNPAGAFVERAGGTIVGCDQDRRACSAAGPVMVGARSAAPAGRTARAGVVGAFD